MAHNYFFYQPFYTLFQTIGLSSGAVFPNDPVLSYKQTLKKAAVSIYDCVHRSIIVEPHMALC